MNTNEKAKVILKALKPIITEWLVKQDKTLIIEIPKIKTIKCTQNGKLK